MTFQGRRYWLVGASDGLGLALARQLHALGAEVILSARDAAKLEAACRVLPGAVPLPLDVRDAELKSRLHRARRSLSTVLDVDALKEALS